MRNAARRTAAIECPNTTPADHSDSKLNLYIRQRKCYTLVGLLRIATRHCSFCNVCTVGPKIKKMPCAFGRCPSPEKKLSCVVKIFTVFLIYIYIYIYIYIHLYSSKKRQINTYAYTCNYRCSFQFAFKAFFEKNTVCI